MPSVLTGAYLANKDLVYMGISGDGDSAEEHGGDDQEFVPHCPVRG